VRDTANGDGVTLWNLLPYVGATALVSSTYLLWRVARAWREPVAPDDVGAAELAVARATLALHDAMTSARFGLAPLAARAREGDVSWIRGEAAKLAGTRRLLERSIAACDRAVPATDSLESASHRMTLDLVAAARRTSDTLRRVCALAEQPRGAPLSFDEPLREALLLAATEPHDSRFHLDVLRQLRSSLPGVHGRGFSPRGATGS
jgi:hypothetical protein